MPHTWILTLLKKKVKEIKLQNLKIFRNDKNITYQNLSDTAKPIFRERYDTISVKFLKHTTQYDYHAWIHIF